MGGLDQQDDGAPPMRFDRLRRGVPIALAGMAAGVLTGASGLWLAIGGMSASAPQQNKAAPDKVAASSVAGVGEEHPYEVAPVNGAASSVAGVGEEDPYKAAPVKGTASSDVGAGEEHPWAGNYRGTFETMRGPVDGFLGIRPISKDRLDFNFDVRAETCVITSAFQAPAPRGDKLVIALPRDEAGLRCRLTIKQNGPGFDISEKDCAYYRGFECSFDGEVRP
jgi:hypothetical protein